MLNGTEDEDRYAEGLENRARTGHLREMKRILPRRGKLGIEVDGRPCINFCSNDYLGLSSDPEVIARSVRYTQSYGAGSASSRLVSGNLDIHDDLEKQIATFYGREAALFLPSGYQANVTLLAALAGRGDLILADKEVHNSLIQGALLSRADFQRFRHNDPEDLERLLERYRSGNSRGTVWIVTESLFSMGGDRAPLAELIRIGKRYGAGIFVDDAHAFGVLGEDGRGLASRYEGVDLMLATLGKAGGGYGAFLLCSAVLKRWFVNHCNGLIYSTAPPPGVIGAAAVAFERIPVMHRERKRLAANAERVRQILNDAGYDTGLSDSHIVPVLMESEQAAVELSARLLEEGIFLQAIRPPTVQQSRLRLTLTSLHTRMEIDRLLEALVHD